MSDQEQGNVRRINNARLFRPEAVAAYANRRVGEPWLNFSSHAWIATALLTLFAGVGGWLIWTTWSWR